MFCSWFFYFKCLDWTTSSPCRKTSRDCSCSVIRLKKGRSAEISCNSIISHSAMTGVSFFCYFQWREKRQGRKCPEGFTCAACGGTGYLREGGWFCWKMLQKWTRNFPDTQRVFVSHPAQHTHKGISSCCCQDWRENLGRYCVGLLHPWWSPSETSSSGETHDLTQAPLQPHKNNSK